MKNFKRLHDEALLRSMENEKRYLVWLYLIVGAVAVVVGFIMSTEITIPVILLVGGMSLIVLSIEKMVSRRVICLIKSKAETDASRSGG